MTLAPEDWSIIFPLSCFCFGSVTHWWWVIRPALILAATTFHPDRMGRDKEDGVERESGRPIKEQIKRV